MKLSLLSFVAYSASLVVAAPQTERDATTGLSSRDVTIESFNALERRKGGGGGGGGKGGGGGGSSGGSSGGKSGSSGSGSGSGSGSSGTRTGGTNSNTGGRTTTGTGPPPAYGSRYTGGAREPYKAGGNSPTRKIAPYAIGGAAIGGIGAYYAVGWIYPVYAYPYYPLGYTWAGDDGRNHTTNVTCLCQAEQTCGCDPDDDQAFLARMITNSTDGTGAPVNTSIVKTAIFPNGSAVTYINGSLQNGTTAAGGTIDPNAASTKIIGYGGYGVMAATVMLSVFML